MLMDTSLQGFNPVLHNDHVFVEQKFLLQFMQVIVDNSKVHPQLPTQARPLIQKEARGQLRFTLFGFASLSLVACGGLEWPPAGLGIQRARPGHRRRRPRRRELRGLGVAAGEA